MTSWLPFFPKTTKGDINTVALLTFYSNFTCKNVLITKSIQKHTNNKLFASFEPEIPTHLYKENLGI